MNTLLTPQRAVELAFAGGEYTDPAQIAAATIAAAEGRYLKPVTGPALYEALCAGRYPQLAEEWAAPAAAAAVRLLVLPRLHVQTGGCGLAAVAQQGWRAAGDRAVTELLKQARTELRALLARLADHLETRRDDYPEYDPGANILNRCRIHGDLVQIR